MKNYYSNLVEICSEIEQGWQKINYASEDFYRVVQDYAHKLDLAPLGEVSHQLELLEDAAVRKYQTRSTFSDLYMQVFNNGRFMVEILNWWGGQVNPHDHDFSALQFQLKGDSLNVQYDFKAEEGGRRGALELGSLSVRKAEIWKEGSCSVVRHGDLDPHGVSHLGKPTTSLLIRTLPTPRFGSQNNYFSNLRAHYTVNSDVQRKKMTGLALLASSSSAEFEKHLRQFWQRQSLAENFFMFLKLGSLCFKPESVHLMEEFSELGEDEATVIRSVATNIAVDFFKISINSVQDATDSERLAVFALAASHSRENFTELKKSLSEKGTDCQWEDNISSFIAKLSEQQQVMARDYLKLLI